MIDWCDINNSFPVSKNTIKNVIQKILFTIKNFN